MEEDGWPTFPALADEERFVGGIDTVENYSSRIRSHGEVTTRFPR